LFPGGIALAEETAAHRGHVLEAAGIELVGWSWVVD
jgi:hypothetical protein